MLEFMRYEGEGGREWRGREALERALAADLAPILDDVEGYELEDAVGAVGLVLAEREQWAEREQLGGALAACLEGALLQDDDRLPRAEREGLRLRVRNARAQVVRTLERLWPAQPWLRQEGERARDYSAFVDYMLSEERYFGPQGAKRAARWRWDARAAEWDARQAARLVEAVRTSRPRMAAQLERLGADLLVMGGAQLEKRLADLSPSDLLAALRLGQEMRAEARREADEAVLDALERGS